MACIIFTLINCQTKYNNDGTIRAIPIIVYHRVGESGDIYNTSLKLFEAQMNYLYENDFKVLTMADLAYNDKSNYFFVKEFQPETMTVVKSTPNFTEVPLKGVSTTEVPLKAVSTTGSNATETMVNFTEVPLKGVSTTELQLKADSITSANITVIKENQILSSYIRFQNLYLNKHVLVKSGNLN